VSLSLTDVDLSSPDSFVPGVPFDMFDVLRREAPVYRHPGHGGPDFWAVTSYHDVIGVSRDAGTFSSAARTALFEEPDAETLSSLQLMMLNMDPPMHTKLRLLVNKGFTPRMVGVMEERIRLATVQVLDNVARGGGCDFVSDIAAELPLMVIAEVMGVPVEDRAKVFDWSNRLIGFEDPEYNTSMESAQEASMELYAYANNLAAERRADPRNDLVSVLLEAEVGGEKLTELEFDLFFLLLAVAGNETTRNAISHGMLGFFDHSDQWQRLLADPALIPTTVEEVLRWASPVMHFRRTAMKDTQIGGVPIAEGDKVVVWYISANRDENIFGPTASTFDIGRTPNEHIAFGGGGPHFCLGANLAKLEIRVMFEELSKRLPDIALDGNVRRLRSNFINGIKEMPVRFTPERG
jgi:cholest-4-en-3-one 26-monooxygenase